MGRVILRLRHALVRYEKAVARFAISPWSSGLLLLFFVAWCGFEAARGKAPGWDGVATFAAFEVGLATLRRLKPDG